MEGFPSQEMRNAHVTAATHHEVNSAGIISRIQHTSPAVPLACRATIHRYAHHSATSASSHCHRCCLQAEVLPVKALTSQDMPAQPAWLAGLTSVSVSQLAFLHATTSCLPAKALVSCRSVS